MLVKALVVIAVAAAALAALIVMIAAVRVLRGADGGGVNEKVRTAEKVVAIKESNGRKEVIE